MTVRIETIQHLELFRVTTQIQPDDEVFQSNNNNKIITYTKKSHSDFPRSNYNHFPIILNRNGDVWPHANRFLLNKLKAIHRPSFKTLESIAIDLQNFRRWLDEKEIEYTLSFQFKYAKDDLTIIDWDGAFLFDPKGDFEESIDLFQLANFQLLRYRILDEDLSERIQKAYKLIQLNEHKGFLEKFRTKEIAQAFKEIIRIRSQSISQFESLDKDIKLIGDWYSARIYDLLSKKFKLDIWASNVKRKLDTLEDIYTIASENLGMSRMQVAEFVQIGAWFVLQFCWFILIDLELLSYTRH